MQKIESKIQVGEVVEEEQDGPVNELLEDLIKRYCLIRRALLFFQRRAFFERRRRRLSCASSQHCHPSTLDVLYQAPIPFIAQKCWKLISGRNWRKRR